MMSGLADIRCLVGTGGVGTGHFYELIGRHTLGRNESRGGYLKNWLDFCKLHIIAHTFTVLTGPPLASDRKIHVFPVGRVGDDPEGQSLISQMQDAGMDCSYMRIVRGTPTLQSISFMYPDSSGGNITAVNSASSFVTPEDIMAVRPVMRQYQGRGIALAAPEVPLAARRELLNLATRYGFYRVASFTSTETREAVQSELLREVDLLAINFDEAEALLRTHEQSLSVPSANDIEEFCLACAQIVHGVNPEMSLIITLGSRGAWIAGGGRWSFVPPLRVKPVNTAGAGDAFLAGTLAGLWRGMPLHRPAAASRPTRADQTSLQDMGVDTACEYGALVAAFAVTSPHAIALDLTPERIDLCARQYNIDVSIARDSDR